MTLEQARLEILPAPLQEYFDERAGVYEYDGEIAKSAAELLAFEDLKIKAK